MLSKGLSTIDLSCASKWFATISPHFTTGPAAVVRGPLVKCGENVANQFEAQLRSIVKRPSVIFSNLPLWIQALVA